MNAKELHDTMVASKAEFPGPSEMRDLILRALRLLADAEANDGSTPETDKLGYTGTASVVDLWDHAKRLERERNGLAARVAELEAALDRYGCHADSCGDMDAMNGAEIKSCNCGLDAARSK